MEERQKRRSSEEIYIINQGIMDKKILKAVLEDELVDGVEIKKGEKHEFDESMADYLLRAYSNHRELVEESEKEDSKKEEKKEEKKAEKKVSKKK